MAPRTDAILIVAHGSPSDPEPQETSIAALAAKVGARLTGCEVRATTLAADGALETAVATLQNPVIYPHFMSDGWFVSSQLPRRLTAAGLARWRMATPLGLLSELPRMALDMSREIMEQHHLPQGDTTLVLAAHGSPADPRPAKATYAFARALNAEATFRDIRVGFVDETPSLKEAARVDGPALVMPFFAASAGHVQMDLPDALAAAKFGGPVMCPIGLWPRVSRLIARSLERHLTARAA